VRAVSVFRPVAVLLALLCVACLVARAKKIMIEVCRIYKKASARRGWNVVPSAKRFI